MDRRLPLLLTVSMLAATLSLALPNLEIEIGPSDDDKVESEWTRRDLPVDSSSTSAMRTTR